ncbi:MAG TPA: hypothetical protein DEB24_04890, partial [Coriobacteriia bacterium]|nr:hypothetical protein [Coriobacteriia bacterium]
MLQLVNFLAQNARQLPDKTALVFKERSLTWKELNAQVNALANGLSDIGVCKGDTVAYFMRNSVELVVIWWATQKIGAIALPVSTFLLPREIEEILSVTDCKTIIYQDIKDFRSRLESATENLPHPLCTLVIGRAAQGEIDFCDLLSQSSDEESEIELEEEDGSLLLFTSGTTGAPKGVLRTQRIVRDYALMLAIENTTDRNEIVLMTHCPMFHTAGMSILMRAAVLGAPLILVEGCHEHEVLSLIDRHRVTHLLFVPPTLYVRLAAVDDGSYDLSSVVEAQCSGG